MTTWKQLFHGGLTGALILVSGRAWGQADLPVDLQQHTEAVVVPLPEAPPPQLKTGLGAGGTLNTGNTRAIAANAGGQLFWRSSPHQLSLEALGTLTFADDPEVSGTKYERSSGGAIGRARYDLFLSDEDALFVAISPRRDVNAGLDLRLQNQVGYLRNLYHPNDSHRLWIEAGYDLTYDNFAEVTLTSATDLTAISPDAVDALAELSGLLPGNDIVITSTTTVEPDPELIHSARAFLGYTNQLNAKATVNVGADALFDFEDAKNVRVNGVLDFSSSINDHFKLGVQFRALFDNVPVPGKEKLDTITALQVLYTYDSLATAEAPAPCDCAAEIAAACGSCLEDVAVGESDPAVESAVEAQPPSEPSSEPAGEAAPREPEATPDSEAAPVP